ncbi:complex I subunit 5 family protein [Pseudonocardia asaccharolytica]|uniref:Cation:proton antiporter n=1 Tax=Pseudonocardia asaccharolytica DSM 44247 = NBRC 16224 TaxID=1123024 RepID=A0A511D332_9PSEU|nr:complex I subunit 5 family protein [Pseudonocardia asaccharolytica]GEL19087.1 cation:proton antiporter [Pseudonocardia asaccharolytica DSM 44247 = NBRC 16224]
MVPSADPAATHLAPLAFTVPIIVACLLLALGRRLPRWAVDGLATTTAAAVAGIDVLLLMAARDGRVVTWAGGWTPVDGTTVGIALVADPLGVGAALIAAILMLCALVFSWRYFDSAEAHLHALMLLFLAGMTGFVLTGDLFNMFVFFELMGAVAYALTGFKIEDPTSVHGALSFGVVNSLGAYLTLCGIGILYARTGELGLAQLAVALRGNPPEALLVTAFVLVLTGWLVKAAMVPFHFWTADAEAVAPTPVCLLFSGIMVALGVYGTFRVYHVVFAPVLPAPGVQCLFLVFGAVTAVVGAVMCFAQRHLKRLLAYSTIAHVGLFLLAFGTLDAAGTEGGALYVAGHAGIKSALFLMSGVILNRYGSVDEIDLHGRGRHAVLLPWLMPLAGLALAGLPPFGLGMGKAVAEEAVATAGGWWAVAVFVLVSAATGGAVIRAALRIYRGTGRAPEASPPGTEETSGTDEEAEVSGLLQRVPLTMLVPIVVLLLGALALGVVPGVSEAFHAAASRFTDGAGYVARTLGAPAPLPAPTAPSGWTLSGVALSLLSSAMALAFALAALHHDRLPATLRAAARPVAPVLRGVRALHSGHVGDYVAWLFVGVAVLGAFLAAGAL